MKKILVAITLLASSNLLAASIDCKVNQNSLGVESIQFTNPQTSLGDFKNMVVTFNDNATDEYTTSLATTVDSSSVEETEHATFADINKNGFASLSFRFYVLPNQQSKTGFSPKHGANMIVILPPATETIALSCVKRL